MSQAPLSPISHSISTTTLTEYLSKYPCLIHVHVKPVGLVHTLPGTSVKLLPVSRQPADSCYDPFISAGSVSLTDNSETQVPIRILRDTGASQSIILSDVLPWSDSSACGYNVLLQGIEIGYVPVPLHYMYLQSELVSGRFKVAVQPSLPVKGITLVMGNDIAGGLVSPVLEVLDAPEKLAQLNSVELSSVYPACAVTRAQSRRQGDVIGLNDTIFDSVFRTDDISSLAPTSPASIKPPDPSHPSPTEEWMLPVTRVNLIERQKTDPTLRKCYISAVTQEQAKEQAVSYLCEDGLLLRKRSSHKAEDAGRSVFQIVVPTPFRTHILSLAHDIPWSGHLGVTKTYNRVLQNFFWPGLKKDVVHHCRTCHTCQMAGKPNQVIPQAPLCTIPVMGEPFERVIVDCVGPLPKTRSGNQYLLTIMCAATRYPEAIPLRKITSKVVVSALNRFFSVFGLPKVIKTEQGTNFMFHFHSTCLPKY